MFQVIEATVSDAVAIAAISRETFFDTFAEQNTREDMDIFLKEQFTTSQIEAEVGKPGNTFLLVKSEKQIAGYAFLKEYSHPASGPNSSLEISRIYVRKPFIGMGAGKLLMESALKQAKKLAKSYVWLGVWEFNPVAIAFYQRFGFVQFGTQDFLLGNDWQHDLLMKKMIDISTDNTL